MKNPFAIGHAIHGFAGGYFGRDSYHCRTVEAVGPDWVVTRNLVGKVELIEGYDIHGVTAHADDRSYCEAWGCAEDATQE